MIMNALFPLFLLTKYKPNLREIKHTQLGNVRIFRTVLLKF